MKIGPILFLATALALGGCLPPTETAKPVAAGQPAAGGPPPLDAGGNAPAGTEIPPPGVDEKQLATLEAEVAKREKAGDKKAIAEAKIALAMATMSSGQAPTKMYPTALKLFREAKVADPANKDAEKWIGMIEGIYKSMKRPVPK